MDLKKFEEAAHTAGYNEGYDVGYESGIEEVLTLRAKLAEVEAERDACREQLKNWQDATASAHEALCLERDVYRDSVESAWIVLFDENVSIEPCHLSTHIRGMLRMFDEVLDERDEARRWAKVWKRSAKMWRLLASHGVVNESGKWERDPAKMYLVFRSNESEEREQ